MNPSRRKTASLQTHTSFGVILYFYSLLEATAKSIFSNSFENSMKSGKLVSVQLFLSTVIGNLLLKEFTLSLLLFYELTIPLMCTCPNQNSRFRLFLCLSFSSNVSTSFKKNLQYMWVCVCFFFGRKIGRQ